MNYVIYQGSGGLIHMLGGLVYCIEYCKKNKHFLIIDVKNHFCFNQNFGDFFYLKDFINYSEDYNMIPKEITAFKRIPLEFISKNNAIHRDNINGYWLKNINVNHSLDSYDKTKDKIKIYVGHGGNNKYNILRYIGVKPEILDLIKKNNIENKYIGIHFRNSDRINNINDYIKTINTYHNITIYLATDDSTAYDIILKNTLDNNIIQFTKPIDCNGNPIHFSNVCKRELVLNLLTDMYFLINSTTFIPSHESLISRLILYIRKTGKNIFN
jgi:hypothetical protein